MQTPKRIEKREIEDIFAITPMQEGMLFHYLEHPGSEQYLEQLIIRLKGQLNSGHFRQAWELVATANEMLRTVPRWEKLPRPVLVQLRESRLDIRFTDLSQLAQAVREAELQQLVQVDRSQQFTFDLVPFRLNVICLQENQFVVIITFHHILLDGWSTGVILKEFFAAYRSLSRNQLPERVSKPPFKKFVKQIELLPGDEAAAFWQEQLANLEIGAQLPRRADRRREDSAILQKYTLLLSDSISNQLLSLTREQNLTQAAVFYTVWGLLLQKLAYREDSVFGTTVSGRNLELTGIEEMVGLFINTVPLRIKSHAGQTVLELLHHTQTLLQQRTGYEHTPLVNINQALEIRAGENLFDSIIAIENYPLEDLLLAENDLLSMESYEMHELTNLPLTVSIELFTEVRVSLIAEEGMFDPGFIERTARQFERMLTALVENPQAEAQTLTLLTPTAAADLLTQLNDTTASYPREKVLHQLFEEQVRLHTGRVAVAADDRELTYGELNCAANQLARRLQEVGVGPGKIVALMVERSAEMLTGILAILKAGGAYLPILPDYPAERIRYMLDDSRTEILVTESHLTERAAFTGAVVLLRRTSDAAYADSDLPVVNTPDHLLYIIYTSGSTGRPKGVMIEHHNAVRLLTNDRFMFDFTEHDIWTLFHSVSFDFSVWEMYGALLYGGKLVVVPASVAKDTRAFRELLQREQVTVLNQTPSAFYNLLVEEMQYAGCELRLRYIIFGGEALQTGVLKPWKEKYPATKLINMYGITETTVHVTFKELSLEDIAANLCNIGTPIPTLQVYLLDRQLQLLPPGMTGEICVGGAGVARGYLHRPELTEERFIPDPYCPGGRLYRSGDLARLLPTGELEYVGRADQQVKIRGFRIELGEIESQLLCHPSIEEAAVLVRENPGGERSLAAFIASRHELSVSALRSFLLTALPEYMLPAQFIKIERLPITANGKVDKRALLAITEPLEPAREYTAPANPVEEILLGIWKEVLNPDRPVGVEDNFFELGGHSLKLTALVAKIHREFNVQIALSQVFAAPTVREQASIIRPAQIRLYQELCPVEEREYYPLTPAQKRLYVLQQLAKDSVGYNMTGVVRLKGEVNQDRLIRAVTELINRHRSLRTSFHLHDGEPVQVVHHSVQLPLETLHLDQVEDVSEAVERIIQKLSQPFALEQAPLLRVKLVHVEPDEVFLILDMHHIIADGISLAILQRELLELYTGKVLPQLPVHYTDYAAATSQLQGSEVWNRQQEYWLSRFAGGIPVLDLPTDYPRPTVQDFRGDSLQLVLTGELLQQLQNLARQQKATQYMVLLAAYNTLLYRYTGQTDLVVGSPVAGRPVDEVQQVVGMFVNMLALRNRPEGGKTFAGLLAEVKEAALGAYENQEYPLEELIAILHLERDLSRNPLFDTVLALQNMEQVTWQVTDAFQVEHYPFTHKAAKFDLSFILQETGDGLTLDIEYSTRLFAIETVRQLGQHYLNVLQAVIADPAARLAELPVLSTEERAYLLSLFSGEQWDVPDVTVQQLLLTRFAANPDRVAVVSGKQQLTCCELDARAGQLAIALQQYGIRQEVITAIMLENSPEQICAVLAVIKAGGAFLLIAPDTPLERVEFMLQDTQAPVLLTDQMLTTKFNFTGQVLGSADWPGAAQADPGTMSHVSMPESQPHELAYVIYTSGTTGQPKGVQIEHHSLLNLCLWHNRQFAITAADRATRLAGSGFDASIWEMLPYLLAGACLHIIPEEFKLNMPLLNQYMEESQITVAFLPTQLAEQFMQLTNSSLRLLLTGGDKLKSFVKRTYQLVNNYGPTENTVVSTFYPVSELERNIPIGRPVDNVQVFILDAANNLQPAGVPGELCLAGTGLARGYLNRPELTEEKFSADPFIPGRRIYHTGDRAMYLRDGNIAFLGRLDDQVQLRGYRIETGEIESVLLRHQEISEALVLAEEDSTGVVSLTAFLVTARDWTRRELRHYLATTLPQYMIPASFMRVAAFPLTANGKIDRQLVRLVGTPFAAGEEYVAPETAVEAALAEIWSELLACRVGRKDNFFELGGHSLKVATLAGEIQKRLQVTLPLSVIFTHPTVAELAVVVADASREEAALVQPADNAAYYPVTPAQKRMYILNQLESDNIAYNMPTLFRIQGTVDPERLEQAFSKLIARHDALRTGFTLVNGATVQIVVEQVQFALQYLTATRDTLPEILKEYVRPFDLRKPPLLRAALIRVAEVGELLMLDLHHIIADGQSLQICIKELINLYDGHTLAPLAIQYKDFAVWWAQHHTPETMRAGEDYWLKEFAGEIPVLDLPADFPRPAFQSFAGNTIRFALNPASFAQLKRLLAAEQVTLYMACLASYTILLSKLTGQEDLVVGMPVSGRMQQELAGVMGMFVNTLALRCQPSGELTFTGFLAQVKKKTLAAFDHQDYQFEDLVDRVGVKRDLSRNPLFDTMLVMQSFDAPELRGNTLTVTPYQLENTIAKFDLELSVYENDSSLQFILDYCTKLFKAETVECFSRYLLRIFEAVAENAELRLADLQILSTEEKAQLIYGFNNNRAEFPHSQSVYHFVEHFAVTQPDKVALSCAAESLTYAELNAQVNRLARLLRKQGTGEDQLVGILLDRSVLMAVSILAVWKAGGAYIPLDPEYPAERIMTILSDSATRVLLTSAEYAKSLEGCIPDSCAVLLLDHCWAEVAGQDAHNLNLPLNMNSLAYVIYTSGSTGKPKGAMVEHTGMMNHMQAKIHDLHLTSQCVVAQNASQCFDISVWQFFVALRMGGRTVIYSKELVLTPAQLIDRVITDRITILEVVPSYLAALLDAVDASFRTLPDLRYLLVTGEIVKPTLVKRWFAHYPAIPVVNAYGPTEASDDITHYIMTGVPEIERIPVGRPVQNFHIYIVDQYMQLVPAGVKGEICVSGIGVGRGYLHNPEKTEAAFMRDPFVEEERRLYKTGDLGRWLPDGVIDFFGRKDYQVKIRGFRIELGEIESVLAGHPDVKEAVVLDREDGKGQKYLCAYIVAVRALTVPEMREYLAQRLPDYMIPPELVQLEQIPLNPNGKVDRKALLTIESQSAGSTGTYVPPQTDFEQRMVEIWKEVLELEQVGVNDNFFDVGGNSFDIIAVKNKLTGDFAEDLPVVTLFKYPTIRTLVRHLEQLQAQSQIATTGSVEQCDRAEVIDKGKDRLKQRMRRRGDQ